LSILSIHDLFFTYDYCASSSRVLNKNKDEINWLFKEINFTIDRGESIGVIGNNGAGKSTLLKLISGTLLPDLGTIKSNGKVTSVINLTSGLFKDMSVSENIVLNCRMRGISSNEIMKLQHHILEFAGIEDRRDAELRILSSGMISRLAFSIVINIKSDLILLDEILAVGDITFRNKCIERVRYEKAQGTAFLYVTHDQGELLKLAEKTVILNRGLMSEKLETQDAIKKYNLLNRI
jgi:lipopolysaccharide transport system ATP-binding protein